MYVMRLNTRFLMPCCVGLILAYFSQIAGAASAPEWALKADADNYCSGEPIALALHMANSSNEKLALDFGQDGVEAFTFEICEQQGETQGKTVAPEASARDLGPGLSIRRRLELTPTGAADLRLALNRWCSTVLPEGTYTVICRIHLTPHAPVELRTPIVIAKADNQRLQAALERLWQISLHGPSSNERACAREMLCYCQAPLSARYKVVIALSTINSRDLHAATEGLACIDDLQAARYLVSMAEDDFLPVEVHREAVAALYEIRDHGKPDVLDVTAATAKKFQRPPKNIMGY